MSCADRLLLRAPAVALAVGGGAPGGIIIGPLLGGCSFGRTFTPTLSLLVIVVLGRVGTNLCLFGPVFVACGSPRIVMFAGICGKRGLFFPTFVHLESSPS